MADFDGLCFVGQVYHGELNGSVQSTTYIRLWLYVVLTDVSGTHHANCCYESSLEDIAKPAVEEQCPTLYDYVYFAC